MEENCFMCAGLSLLRPVYYEYPEAAEAYSFDRQVLEPCGFICIISLMLVVYIYLSKEPLITDIS